MILVIFFGFIFYLQNISLKSAHVTPKLSTPKSYTSPLFLANRSLGSVTSTSHSSTPNTSEFRCHLCDFSTTRLNVIVLHNKTHATDPVIKSVVETPHMSGRVVKYFDEFSTDLFVVCDELQYNCNSTIQNFI